MTEAAQTVEQPVTATAAPRKPPIGRRFTAQEARAMQAKATRARKLNHFNRKFVAAQMAQERERQLMGGNPAPDQKRLNARAHAVDIQIERTLAMMAETADAKETQALATALDKLYATWSLLTGHARPAPSKPRRGIQAAQIEGMPE